jgi:hypothetical protein
MALLDGIAVWHCLMHCWIALLDGTAGWHYWMSLLDGST